MDFMTNEELDAYLVLKGKILALKKTLKDFGTGKYSKRVQRTDFTTILYMNYK